MRIPSYFDRFYFITEESNVVSIIRNHEGSFLAMDGLFFNHETRRLYIFYFNYSNDLDVLIYSDNFSKNFLKLSEIEKSVGMSCFESSSWFLKKAKCDAVVNFLEKNLEASRNDFPRNFFDVCLREIGIPIFLPFLVTF